MPNIFKRFLQPNASDFVFPDVEELVEEEPADTAGEQEGEPEESAPEAEEKDTPSAVDFAQIQAEKILEDARRQAEDYLVRRQMEAEQEAELRLEQALQRARHMGREPAGFSRPLRGMWSITIAPISSIFFSCAFGKKSKMRISASGRYLGDRLR